LMQKLLEVLTQATGNIDFDEFFTKSMGIESQSLPGKLRTELWMIVLDTVLETNTKTEAEITEFILTKVLLNISDKKYRENYLQKLKKNVKTFSGMDKQKVIAIFEKVEVELKKIISHNEFVELKNQHVNKQILAYLKGEQIENMGSVEINEQLLQFLNEQPEQAAQFLQSHLKSDKIRKWWMTKLSETVLTKIIFLVAPRHFSYIQSSTGVLWNAVEKATIWKDSDTLADKWFYVFESLAVNVVTNDLDNFRTTFIKRIVKDVSDYNKKEFLKDVTIELSKKIQTSDEEIYLDTIAEIKKIALNAVAGEDEEAEIKVGEDREIIENTEFPIDLEEDTTEGVYVQNAGIVIAAPCIMPLFAKFNLLDKNQFKSIDEQDRAVHLIQYMVDECTTTPEFLLTLNKVLCGVHQGRPIAPKIDITDFEIEVITQVIKDMITHWKVIPNTSVAGLRETFFQREGVLRFKENLWELQVEEKTFDVLIDQIPWNFSTIKYAWMTHPLYVKWR
ncbi:MAG: hypothetical protein MI922_14130, partial [Bacteroidales bacterium]|nr:hypothetical protein [Bacteroidales bacterium]